MAGDVAVLGNVNLDLICRTIDEVPRYESIGFDRAAVTPGGCGSNVSLNLHRLGVNTWLVGCAGQDLTGNLLYNYWEDAGLDTRFLVRIPGINTGISIGLVDSSFQPRFMYTPGANTFLTPDLIPTEALIQLGVKWLHAAGFFVLPGLLQSDFKNVLDRFQAEGIYTSLDVVTSPAIHNPEPLWEILPALDLLMCNLPESRQLTGKIEPEEAAAWLREKGAAAVVIKLGENGCLMSTSGKTTILPAEPVDNILDTTGAGDAFAAGLLASLSAGDDLEAACRAGNREGARTVQFFGAVQ